MSGEFNKHDRVIHPKYGHGTVTRTTKKPVRTWVKWDLTGFTTPVRPEILEGEF